MGVTTRTASVMPAARPAKEEYLADEGGVGVLQRTDECGSAADGAGLFICKKLLIPFERCKSYCHLRNNPCHNSSQAFVKCQWCFSFDDLLPRRQKAASLYLKPTAQLSTVIQRRDFIINIPQEHAHASRAAFGL